MSGLLAGKVWQSNLDARLKPLAAALADIGDNDGSNIFPSIEHIAWLLGDTDGERLPNTRSVQRGMKELRDMGILVVVKNPRGGRNLTVHYQLIEDKLPKRPTWRTFRQLKKGDNLSSFQEIGKGDNSEQKGDNSDIERVTPVSPDPLETSKSDPLVIPLSRKARREPTAEEAYEREIVDRLIAYLESKNGPLRKPRAEILEIKWLLDNGYDQDQCKACLDWAKTDTWYKYPVTWATVAKRIGDWVAKGSPKAIEQSSRPQNNGYKEPQKYGDVISEDEHFVYTVGPEGPGGTVMRKPKTPEGVSIISGMPVEEVRKRWN